MDRLASASNRANRPSRPVIWFEVEDFLEHFDRAPKPAGIQRVQMEIFSVVSERHGAAGEIRFCRLNRFTQRCQAVDFNLLLKTFDRPPLRYAAPRLVPDRNPWRAWLVNEREKFRSTRHQFYLRVTEHLPWLRRFGLPSLPAPLSRGPFNPGDILVCLGMSWWNIQYIDRVARVKRALGLRFAVLVHDVIPVTDPEWMTTGSSVVFRHWILGVLANADLVLAVSNYSRFALAAYAKGQDVTLPPTEVVRPGTGFRALGAAAPRANVIGRLPSGYVLFVSTLEPRKNHRLLVRMWRRLIERHGAAKVPPLVFVGQSGWMVEDLLAELAESRYLDGKIILYSDLSDAELRETYRRCLFSVYPSILEGFGLPVAESLEQGKLCVASRRAAIPEVGGDLVDYIDPDDEAGTLAVLERAIFDDAYRGAREAQISAEYRPMSWAECVDVLLEKLDALSRDTSYVFNTAGAPSLRALNIRGSSR
jgi:glycosyltransferase involved in cell wall biosynthesis